MLTQYFPLVEPHPYEVGRTSTRLAREREEPYFSRGNRRLRSLTTSSSRAWHASSNCNMNEPQGPPSPVDRAQHTRAVSLGDTARIPPERPMLNEFICELGVAHGDAFTHFDDPTHQPPLAWGKSEPYPYERVIPQKGQAQTSSSTHKPHPRAHVSAKPIAHLK